MAHEVRGLFTVCVLDLMVEPRLHDHVGQQVPFIDEALDAFRLRGMVFARLARRERRLAVRGHRVELVLGQLQRRRFEVGLAVCGVRPFELRPVDVPPMVVDVGVLQRLHVGSVDPHVVAVAASRQRHVQQLR